MSVQARTKASSLLDTVSYIASFFLSIYFIIPFLWISGCASICVGAFMLGNIYGFIVTGALLLFTSFILAKEVKRE